MLTALSTLDGPVVLGWALIAIWLGIPAYLAGRILREHLDDRADERRRAHEKRIADAEWFAVLAATGPSLSTHPSASRIRDLIARNEAARLDDEWEAMNR